MHVIGIQCDLSISIANIAGQVCHTGILVGIESETENQSRGDFLTTAAHSPQL